jgi:abhydrolase domain-containing protein 6
MDISWTPWILLTVAAVGSWYFAGEAWAKLLLAIARRGAGLRSSMGRVDTMHWHYLDGGQGPVLVLLHGFGGDADNWLRVAPALRRKFRLIAPDIPGFGDTQYDQESCFDIPAQVERLHAFLEMLGEQPIALAGNSMGGWIAGAYTRAHPGDIQALWLLAPLGVTSAPGSPVLRAIETDQDSPFSISNADQYRRRVVTPMFGRAPWLPAPMLRHYAQRGIRESETAGERFRQIMDSPETLEQIMDRLNIPIHLQWGSQDHVLDHRGANALARRNPGTEVHLLNGIGHLPMLEAPSESAGAWLDFCRRHGII